MNFRFRYLNKGGDTVSELFVELLKKVFFFVWVELIYFWGVVGHERSCLADNFRVHFIVFLHFENDGEVFFDGFVGFSEIRYAVVDLADNKTMSGYS